MFYLRVEIRLFFYRWLLVISGYIQQSIVKEVEPIITGMGFTLVELKFGRSTNQNHVSICVYRSEGVGIDDCAVISKNLLPRLELMKQSALGGTITTLTEHLLLILMEIFCPLHGLF